MVERRDPRQGRGQVWEMRPKVVARSAPPLPEARGREESEPRWRRRLHLTRHPVPPPWVLVGTYLEQQVLREGQALHARQGGLPRLHGKHLFVLEDLQARVDLLQLLHNALHPSPIPTVPLSLSLSLSLSLRARAIDLAPPGSLGLFSEKLFPLPSFSPVAWRGICRRVTERGGEPCRPRCERREEGERRGEGRRAASASRDHQPRASPRRGPSGGVRGGCRGVRWAGAATG